MSVTTQQVQLTLVKDQTFIPLYAKAGDAGCDAKANLTEDRIVLSGDTALVPLGIKVAIPEGYELMVRPRSGLALKNSVTILNSPGCVDSSYRGEVCAIVINHGRHPFYIKPGDRICQLVMNKVEKIQWNIVEELPATDRGEDGFGSSGV